MWIEGKTMFSKFCVSNKKSRIQKCESVDIFGTFTEFEIDWGEGWECNMMGFNTGTIVEATTSNISDA